ncbi:acyltransferase family protein [Burkholderia sp. F1]|uniref:acyltransferase family protein n=1 Tax=Burkholderia sp. F1 TaxID=3366817 RepID=UPI003D746674
MKHTNNFDFLRLFAAFMVLYSHQHALLGLPEPGFANRFSFGGIGVAIFFTISGYLVTQSWERDPRILRFAMKRFLRIWPGLFMVTILAAFVLGPLVSRLPAAEYFHHPLAWRYLNNLLLKISFELPGVFEHNPYPKAVNGSTWTIPLEVRWYLYLLIAGGLTLMRKRWLVLVATILLSVYYFAVYKAETNPVGAYSIDFGLYFCVGALMWLYRDKWATQRYMWITLAALAGASTYFSGQTVLGLLLLIAPLVVIFGEASTPYLRRFGRFGDLSYGVYLYAYVVQQTLAWRFGHNLPFSAYLGLTTAITLACAWLSWHLIEKPALSLKNGVPALQRAAAF